MYQCSSCMSQAMLSQLQGSRSKQIPAKAPAAASAAELEHIEDAGSFPQQLSEAHRSARHWKLDDRLACELKVVFIEGGYFTCVWK